MAKFTSPFQPQGYQGGGGGGRIGGGIFQFAMSEMLRQRALEGREEALSARRDDQRAYEERLFQKRYRQRRLDDRRDTREDRRYREERSSTLAREKAQQDALAAEAKLQQEEFQLRSQNEGKLWRENFRTQMQLHPEVYTKGEKVSMIHLLPQQLQDETSFKDWVSKLRPWFREEEGGGPNKRADRAWKIMNGQEERRVLDMGMLQPIWKQATEEIGATQRENPYKASWMIGPEGGGVQDIFDEEVFSKYNDREGMLREARDDLPGFLDDIFAPEVTTQLTGDVDTVTGVGGEAAKTGKTVNPDEAKVANESIRWLDEMKDKTLTISGKQVVDFLPEGLFKDNMVASGFNPDKTLQFRLKLDPGGAISGVDFSGLGEGEGSTGALLSNFFNTSNTNLNELISSVSQGSELGKGNKKMSNFIVGELPLVPGELPTEATFEAQPNRWKAFQGFLDSQDE